MARWQTNGVTAGGDIKLRKTRRQADFHCGGPSPWLGSADDRNTQREKKTRLWDKYRRSGGSSLLTLIQNQNPGLLLEKIYHLLSLFSYLLMKQYH